MEQEQVQKKRLCKCCKEEKEIKEFYFFRVKRMTKKKGMVESVLPNSFCIPCHDERNRVNKEKRKDEILQYHRDYWKNYKRKPRGNKSSNSIKESDKIQAWEKIREHPSRRIKILQESNI